MFRYILITIWIAASAIFIHTNHLWAAGNPIPMKIQQTGVAYSNFVNSEFVGITDIHTNETNSTSYNQFEEVTEDYSVSLFFSASAYSLHGELNDYGSEVMENLGWFVDEVYVESYNGEKSELIFDFNITVTLEVNDDSDYNYAIFDINLMSFSGQFDELGMPIPDALLDSYVFELYGDGSSNGVDSNGNFSGTVSLSTGEILDSGSYFPFFIFVDSQANYGSVLFPNSVILENGRLYQGGQPLETNEYIMTVESNSPLFPSNAVKSVIIDLKPGSHPNSINLKSKGKVPVAILTTDDFDAFDVDPDTVTFARANPLRWTMEDVDADGDIDLLFHFKTQELDLTNESTEATLEGETDDGIQIIGTDSVNMVPKDRVPKDRAPSKYIKKQDKKGKRNK